MELPELLHRVASVRQVAGRPVTVGISGFGGSGKSSLAAALAARLEGCVQMRGDDFLDPKRSHLRSGDWDGVDRLRLGEEVLSPFRTRTPSMFRRFDWSLGDLAGPEPLPTGEILIVDLIGLFHPETDDLLDLRIWSDVELEQATR